ncbi:hypothetical protein CBM2623_B80049 [Cupriavidus taiwanensis]|nr:hypothetical protein CBM2608_B90052 [Cupriavidus taiwanensis]SPA36421.1 hypothetical protein CBM2623_B80049 [Cupriavidus taiwanensis]
MHFDVNERRASRYSYLISTSGNYDFAVHALSNTGQIDNIIVTSILDINPFDHTHPLLNHDSIPNSPK